MKGAFDLRRVALVKPVEIRLDHAFDAADIVRRRHEI
jgi:hypothetical protein